MADDDTNPRDQIPRRQFLKGAGAAGTAVAAVMTPVAVTHTQAQPQPAAAAPAAAAPETWLTLNPTEVEFIKAAVDAIIPADDLSPSGSDCGVATFIDRQLAGAYGSGARLYQPGGVPQGQHQRRGQRAPHP